MLKNHLSQALNSLSSTPQPIKNFQIFFNEDSPESLLGQFDHHQRNDQLHDVISKSFNPLIYGNDVDSVDIATRITMVQFLNSKNILANFNEHTRTLRLYPRPVVAFQYNSFIRSRPIKSNFIIKLAKTQAIEYLAEWSLYPTNVSYLRIQTGVFDPSLIGDKPKWYCRHLNPIQFKTYNENTTLSSAIAEYNLNKQAGLGTTHNTTEDSDASVDENNDDRVSLGVKSVSSTSLTSEPGSLPIVDMQPHNQVLTTCVDVKSVYQPPSKFINLDANGNENEADDVYSNEDKNSVSIKSSFDYGSSSFTTSSSSSSVGDSHFPSGTENFKKEVLHVTEESVTLPGDSKPSSVTITPVSKTFNFDMINNSGSAENLPKQRQNSVSQPDSPTTPCATAHNKTQKPKQLQLIHQFSDDLSDAASKAARRVGSLVSDSAQDLILKTPKPALTPRPKQYLSSVSIAQADLTRSAIQTKKSQTDNQQLEINSDNQQFLKEVLQQVLDGQGIAWLKFSRFKRLMEDENFRNFLLSRLNTALDKKLLNDEEHIEDVFVKHKSIFKGMCKLLSTIVQGLEHTYANNGIGGMASAFQLLEIVHTHYFMHDKTHRNDHDLSPVENSNAHNSLSQTILQSTPVRVSSYDISGSDSGHAENSKNDGNQISIVTQLGKVLDVSNFYFRICLREKICQP